MVAQNRESVVLFWVHTLKEPVPPPPPGWVMSVGGACTYFDGRGGGGDLGVHRMSKNEGRGANVDNHLSKDVFFKYNIFMEIGPKQAHTFASAVLVGLVVER